MELATASSDPSAIVLENSWGMGESPEDQSRATVFLRRGWKRPGSYRPVILTLVLDRPCQCPRLTAFLAWGAWAVDVMYLDFRQAFDAVPHGALMSGLGVRGLDGITIRWVHGCLNDCTPNSYPGLPSNAEDRSGGVLQG